MNTNTKRRRTRRKRYSAFDVQITSGDSRDMRGTIGGHEFDAVYRTDTEDWLVVMHSNSSAFGIMWEEHESMHVAAVRLANRELT